MIGIVGSGMMLIAHGLAVYCGWAGFSWLWVFPIAVGSWVGYTLFRADHISMFASRIGPRFFISFVPWTVSMQVAQVGIFFAIGFGASMVLK